MNQKPETQPSLSFILSETVPPRPHLRDQAKKRRLLLKKLER